MVSRDKKRSAFFAAVLAFASAALLFGVQPHLGKKLLPTVGGGPAVWNACLVFFQAALLLGYLYAAELGKFPIRRIGVVHAVVLLAACCWLFAAEPPTFVSPDGSPTMQTLLRLFATAGLPVAALSATTPLLHRSAGGYQVYAASNAGSLIALALYPFVVEPNLGLDAQWNCWRWMFVTFAATMIAFGLTRAPVENLSSSSAKIRSHDPRRWIWLFWSALPSMLLVGTTQRITEDIAGGPLLWLPPLALFLIASILAFAGLSPSSRTLGFALAVLLLYRGGSAAISAVFPAAANHLVSELATFFAASWCSFAALYRSRPPDEDASRFYVWLALGGALGGAFSSLVAPRLFQSTAELPLGLTLLCLFLPTHGARPGRLEWFVLACVLVVIGFLRPTGGEAAALEAALLVGGLGMLLALAGGRKAAEGLIVGLPFALLASTPDRGVVHQTRSEFGVHRVLRVGTEERFHALRHGGINHGWQNRDSGRTQEPLGYYHPQSAVGEALAWRKRTSKGGDVAVVGLGAGAALVHRGTDQRFVFFEIDPAVARIAADPSLFSFLEEAKGHAEVRIGDGRRLLSRAPDGSFETIFLDAFSGDAVPSHLLTREAFETYVRTLKPGGVIVVNVTNWFVDLEAVVVRAGGDVGLPCVGKNQTAPRTNDEIRTASTRCLVLSRDADLLVDLAKFPGWERKTASPKSPLWTDDFSDVLSVIRWR